MAFLPSTSAQTLSTGVGERLTSGAGATLDCRVEAEAADSESFGLELDLEHSALPRMRVAGQLRDGTGEGFSVDLSLAGGGALQARCLGVARAVHPGAAWLELRECGDMVWNGEPAACTLSAGVLFEHCAH